MNRKILFALYAWIFLSGPGPGAVLAAGKGPPNIVIFLSDDLGYQAISAYEDERRLLSTPAMDRIAREGIRFDRCLVTNSICGPSRAVLLTGTYSHVNGFYNNSNSRFDGSLTTFPRLLQQAGYSTALIGKWHLQTDPTGFDHWSILPGQGVYYNPDFITMGKRETLSGYVTDLITDRCVDWLKNRDRSKPFLLMCHHKAPHREWSPALRHLNWDQGRSYPVPKTFEDTLSGRVRAVQEHDMGLDRTITDRDMKLVPIPGMKEDQAEIWNRYYLPRNDKMTQAKLSGPDLTRWRYNRYMHDYLGCVKGVDEGIGSILDLLDEEHLTEETIVICSSDQGFYLGEHGWFDKRWIFEESLRTPLMIRWPQVIAPGTVNQQLVSLIDLPETLLEAAQVPVPETMQGRSLLPVLAGKTPPDWRTSFYYRYYEYPVPHHVSPHYGVVTDRYKLIRYGYPGGQEAWELLDREKDPLEMKSYYADPAYAEVVATLRGELTRLQKELNDTGEPPRSAYGNRKFEGELPARKTK